MAVTLAAGINATQNRVTLTEPLTAAPGDLFRIGNEVVEFGGYGRMAGGRLVDHSRKIVSFGRGASGTIPATHTATTAVLRVVDGLISAVGAPDPFVSPAGSSFPLTADVSADGHTISDLADPVADGDAVPKSYVDGVGSGIDPANIVYLESNTPSVGPAVWDSIYDQGQNTIGAIPAAMGMSLVDAGTRVQIDEAGLYWFELMALPDADATAQVDIRMSVVPDYSGGSRVKLLSVADSPVASISAMASVPASALPEVGVTVISSLFGTAPTDGGYIPLLYGVLKIVRLA